MYTQTKALKEGKTVQKPIYNHVRRGLVVEAQSAPASLPPSTPTLTGPTPQVSGLLDPAEEIQSPKILARAPQSAAVRGPPALSR